MDYCAYCGAKMQETADSCPVCGRWRQQVQLPGGGPTVREPLPDEKTRVFSKSNASRAQGAGQAERTSDRRTQSVRQTGRTYHPSERSYAPRTLDSDWKALSQNIDSTVPTEEEWQSLSDTRTYRQQSEQPYAPRRSDNTYSAQNTDPYAAQNDYASPAPNDYAAPAPNDYASPPQSGYSHSRQSGYSRTSRQNDYVSYPRTGDYEAPTGQYGRTYDPRTGEYGSTYRQREQTYAPRQSSASRQYGQSGPSRQHSGSGSRQHSSGSSSRHSSGSSSRHSTGGSRQSSSGGSRQYSSGTRRQQSAVKQLGADVKPAMREVSGRVQSGMSTALKNPHSKERRLLVAAGVLAVFVIMLVLVVKIFSSFGEKGVLNKLADAYKENDPAAVEALSSDLMKALYPGDQLDTDCRNNLGDVKDYFSEHLGSKYRISSKISVDETYSGKELATWLENNFGTFAESYDLSRVKQGASTTLTLKAKAGTHSAEKRIQVILIKEDGKWKLASQSLNANYQQTKAD